MGNSPYIPDDPPPLAEYESLKHQAPGQLGLLLRGEAGLVRLQGPNDDALSNLMLIVADLADRIDKIEVAVNALDKAPPEPSEPPEPSKPSEPSEYPKIIVNDRGQSWIVFDNGLDSVHGPRAVQLPSPMDIDKGVIHLRISDLVALARRNDISRLTRDSPPEWENQTHDPVRVKQKWVEILCGLNDANRVHHIDSERRD